MFVYWTNIFNNYCVSGCIPGRRNIDVCKKKLILVLKILYADNNNNNNNGCCSLYEYCQFIIKTVLNI